MTSFDTREKAFEDKYAHDEEMLFKARARRNKLFGLYIAELLGLSGDAAENYAQDVIEADLKEAGDEDIYEKIMPDLEKAGSDISRHRLEKKLEECMGAAKTALIENG